MDFILIKLAPSILSADCSDLSSEIKKVEKYSSMIHIDVMDGHFVPNLSFGSCIVESLRKLTPLTLDVHLMVEYPSKFIESFVKSGSDIISFHIECLDNPMDVIDLIKSKGIKCGMALRPSTDVDLLRPYIDHLDMVLQMAVEPGFGGQAFVRSSIDSIRKIRAMSTSIDLQVDGGVTPYNVRELFEAGANVIVSGSAVFKNPDPSAVMKDFLSVQNEFMLKTS